MFSIERMYFSSKILAKMRFLLNFSNLDAFPSFFEGMFWLRCSRHNHEMITLFKLASSMQSLTLLWSYCFSCIRVHCVQDKDSKAYNFGQKLIGRRTIFHSLPAPHLLVSVSLTFVDCCGLVET